MALSRSRAYKSLKRSINVSSRIFCKELSVSIDESDGRTGDNERRPI